MGTMGCTASSNHSSYVKQDSREGSLATVSISTGCDNGADIVTVRMKRQPIMAAVVTPCEHSMGNRAEKLVCNLGKPAAKRSVERLGVPRLSDWGKVVSRDSFSFSMPSPSETQDAAEMPDLYVHIKPLVRGKGEKRELSTSNEWRNSDSDSVEMFMLAYSESVKGYVIRSILLREQGIPSDGPCSVKERPVTDRSISHSFDALGSDDRFVVAESISRSEKKRRR